MIFSLREDTIKRLKKKLAERDVEQELNEEVLSHMKEALDYAQENQEVIRKDIESTLLEIRVIAMLCSEG